MIMLLNSSEDDLHCLQHVTCGLPDLCRFSSTLHATCADIELFKHIIEKKKESFETFVKANKKMKLNCSNALPEDADCRQHESARICYEMLESTDC